MAARLCAWDRRPTETAEAFEAFALYRDAGPTRSAASVGVALGKSTTLMERWSGRHDWPARAAAYDTEVARRAAAKTMETDVEALARQVRQARAIQAKAAKRFRTAGDSDALSAADAARVWALAAREERAARRIPTTVEHSGPDGGPIQTTTLTPEEAIALMERRRAAKGNA